MFFIKTRVYKYEELSVSSQQYVIKKYFRASRKDSLEQELSNLIEDRTGIKIKRIAYYLETNTLDLDFELNLIRDIITNQIFDFIIGCIPTNIFEKLLDTEDTLFINNGTYYWGNNNNDSDFLRIGYLILDNWFKPLINEMEQFAQDYLYELPQAEIEKYLREPVFFYKNGKMCSQTVFSDRI